MKMSTIVTVLSSSFAFVMFACSAPPSGLDNAGKSEDETTDEKAEPDATETKTGTKPGTTAGATKPGTTTPNTSTTPAGSGTCSTETTSDACWTCCEDKVPAIVAAVKEIDKKWQQCACEASRCAAACGTDYCQADPTGDATTTACETCLEANTDDCDTAEDAAWTELEAKPIYEPADACAEAAACDAKPAEPDDAE